MRKTIIFSATIIVICIILAGCSSGPGEEEIAASVEAQLAVAQAQTEEALLTMTPSAALNEGQKAEIKSIGEDGWENHLYRDYGFSISLPPKWESIDLSAEDMDELLSAVGETNPELETLYSSEYVTNLAAMGIKMMALDTSADSLGSGIPTNVSVLVLDMPFEISFDDYLDLNIMQLKKLLGEDLVITQEMALFGETEAGAIEYESELNDVFGQAHDVVYRQFLILDDQIQYVLTFTSEKNQFSQNQTTIADIAQSFELVR